MTDRQIKGLKADVLGILKDRVEDIFVEFQDAMKIKSGDVSPLDWLDLEEKQVQLAELITSILIQQKGGD